MVSFYLPLNFLLFSSQVLANVATEITKRDEGYWSNGVWIPPHGHDVDYWCKNIDLNDADAVRDLWVNKGVGGYLEIWSKPPNTESSGPDRWPYKFLKKHAPNLGNDATSGCGIIGSQDCNPNLDCEDMVKNGDGHGGPAYWAIQAVKGFHSKLNVAHEYLQDTTLDNMMSLKDISSDFSTPNNFAKLEQILSMIGTCFYMVGSIAGAGSLAFSRIQAGVMSRPGVAQAKLDMYKKDPQSFGQRAIAAAEAELKAAMAATKSPVLNTALTHANSLSASTYLLGSTFALSTTGKAAKNGQIEPGNLEPVLKELFESARSGLYSFGKLATGGGGDYSQLPHYNETDPLFPEAHIAGFFGDGKMLLGDSNPAFNTSIERAFSMFKLKIVDQAIQTAGYNVILMDGIDEEKCKAPTSQAYFGRQWLSIDGKAGCWALWRVNPTLLPPCPGTIKSCSWTVPDQKFYDALEKKYQIKASDYIQAAYRCTMRKKDNRMPDFVNLPIDGKLPDCWYSIPAKHGKVVSDCQTLNVETCTNKKLSLKPESF